MSWLASNTRISAALCGALRDDSRSAPRNLMRRMRQAHGAWHRVVEDDQGAFVIAGHPSTAAAVNQNRPRSPTIYLSVYLFEAPALRHDARTTQTTTARKAGDPTGPVRVAGDRRRVPGCSVVSCSRESTPADAIAIHARCLVRMQDGHRVMLVAGLPIAHYAVGDAMAEGPSRRRRSCRRLRPVRTKPVRDGLHWLVPATPGAPTRDASHRPSQGDWLRVLHAVAPGDPDSSADGYVRGLESAW